MCRVMWVAGRTGAFTPGGRDPGRPWQSRLSWYSITDVSCLSLSLILNPRPVSTGCLSFKASSPDDPSCHRPSTLVQKLSQGFSLLREVVLAHSSCRIPKWGSGATGAASAFHDAPPQPSSSCRPSSEASPQPRTSPAARGSSPHPAILGAGHPVNLRPVLGRPCPFLARPVAHAKTWDFLFRPGHLLGDSRQ